MLLMLLVRTSIIVQSHIPVDGELLILNKRFIRQIIIK